MSEKVSTFPSSRLVLNQNNARLSHFDDDFGAKFGHHIIERIQSTWIIRILAFCYRHSSYRTPLHR